MKRYNQIGIDYDDFDMFEANDGQWVRYDDVEAEIEARVAAERAKWIAAGFADEKGEPRKVVGTLPVTADGCIVGNHTKLWINNVGYVSSLRVDNIGCSDRDGGDEAFWEAGECYSTREAADAALAALDAGKKGDGNGD